MPKGGRQWKRERAKRAEPFHAYVRRERSFSLATTALFNVNPLMKEGSAGKRLLLLIGGLGALLAAGGVWWSTSPDYILFVALTGIGLILLAWMQFGEEFKKR